MPVRPASPCSKPGCPHRKPCPVHGSSYRRAKDTRPSAAARGYDQKWRRIRAAFLKKFPACVVCGEEATEVDHITPLGEGGSNEWSNLQPMCKSHHSEKTNRFDGGFGNHSKQKFTKANPLFAMRTRNLEARSNSFVVRICGAPASGKSTLRRALEERFGLPSFSIDEERFALVNPGEKWGDSLTGWVNLENAADTHNPCVIEKSGRHGNDEYLFEGRRVFTILCVASESARRERLKQRVTDGYYSADREWRYAEKLLRMSDVPVSPNIVWNTTDPTTAQANLIVLLETVANWLKGGGVEKSTGLSRDREGQSRSHHREFS